MPELPEVEITRLGLLPYVEGQLVTDVVVRNKQLRWPIPESLKNNLLNHVFEGISRRGKYLFWHTAHGCMIVHLGMSGSLRIVTQAVEPSKHDHCVIVFASGRSLFFHDPRRFGAILWTSDDPLQHRLIRDLGLEPLDDAFTGEYLYQQSRGRTQSIKSFIMASRYVVGVGNIYANEALFVAGIHPKRKAKGNSLQRYERLVAAIKGVLNHSIQLGGTTLRDFVDSQGRPGYFQQQLNVYGRGGQACHVCGSVIKQCRLNQRSAFYCPSCQR